jgi:hypothetical protein
MYADLHVLNVVSKMSSCNGDMGEDYPDGANMSAATVEKISTQRSSGGDRSEGSGDDGPSTARLLT